jgi:hypothetical protein
MRRLAAPQCPPLLPKPTRAPQRLAIDYADATELADKSAKALKAFMQIYPRCGRHYARKSSAAGDAPKVAFLYTGQGCSM